MNNDKFFPFPEALSLDPWISKFDQYGRATMHVDVAFSTERVGAEPDANVRFRLSLKRAEVVVLIPPSEPLIVIPESVERNGGTLVVTNELQTTSKAIKHFEADGSLEGELNAHLDKSNMKAKVGLRAGRKKEDSVERKTHVKGQTGPIGSLCMRTADGDYRWKLWSKAGTRLHGRPWDARTVPRFTVEAQDGAYASSIEPTVLVEMRCLYEDIDIQDIQLKDVKRFDVLQFRSGHAARLAAAEAYIRLKVFEGLQSDPLDTFATITLARVRCSCE